VDLAEEAACRRQGGRDGGGAGGLTALPCSEGFATGEIIAMHLFHVFCAVLLLGAFATTASGADKPDVAKIHGRIQVVSSFPDYKVKIVESFADLHVQIVESFPDAPGKWQMVDSFPDYKIQFVDSFPDFTIRYVTSFPGVP
jgi:hypothetical protein